MHVYKCLRPLNKNQWEQKVVLSYLANGIQKIYLLFLLLLLFAGENKILHKKQIFSNYQIWLKTSKFDANKSFLMTPEFFFFLLPHRWFQFGGHAHRLWFFSSQPESFQSLIFRWEWKKKHSGKNGSNFLQYLEQFFNHSSAD